MTSKELRIELYNLRFELRVVKEELSAAKHSRDVYKAERDKLQLKVENLSGWPELAIDLATRGKS